MTKVINLLGGPGILKSTLAAELYAKMKRNHMDVELVREVAKEWAHEGKEIGSFEQIAIIGEQIKKESSLFNKVEYVVTDSPVLLGGFYFEYNHNQIFMNNMIRSYYKYSQDKGIIFYNYMLTRKDNSYNTKGRFETEQEAYDIDQSLCLFMAADGYDYKLIDDSNVIDLILGDLK